MPDLLWLLAVPLALAVDWCLDEDTRAAVVMRLRARPALRAPRPGAPLAYSTPEAERVDTEAHRAMLQTGLAASRRRWEGYVERGFPALAEDAAKATERISRELGKLPPAPNPTSPHSRPG